MKVCLLRFNVPVNNFSAMSGRSHHFLGIIGRFQAIKTDVLLIFSFITGDKTEFLSPMMFSNEYITGIWLSEFYLINFLLLSIKFNANV